MTYPTRNPPSSYFSYRRISIRFMRYFKRLQYICAAMDRRPAQIRRHLPNLTVWIVQQHIERNWQDFFLGGPANTFFAPIAG